MMTIPHLMNCPHQGQGWCLGCVQAERFRIQAEMIAYHEGGVYGRGEPTDIYPDWVYEARTAIKHQNDNLPWLADLLAALGWQSGTIHTALNAVRRLVAAEPGDRRRVRVLLETMADTLCDVAQLLDGWHADGTAWSEWDESVRQKVSVASRLVDELRTGAPLCLTGLPATPEAAP
jgi:hypothetical protein